MRERLAGRRFATFIADEAQNLKNPATRRARAARAVSADVKFALSGTPVENHVGVGKYDARHPWCDAIGQPHSQPHSQPDEDRTHRT